MFYNSKVIRENEFMPREKVLLLQVISALKRLGEDESVVQSLVSRTKEDKTVMLNGVLEQLTVLRDKYAEESYGYEVLSNVIRDLNGGEKHG